VLAGSVVMCVFAARAIAAAPSSSGPASAANTEVALRERQAEDTDLGNRVKTLENDLSYVYLPLTVLVGLLAAGGVAGLVTSFKQERRQVALHRLTVNAEDASHEQRIASFQDSRETLTLVNNTLSLANQASERAAEAMKQTASDELLELDGQIGELLDELHEERERDFKAIVKNDSLREELEDIARSLSLIGGNLKLQRLPLTPRCLFVKGFDLHLKSAPRPALICLRDVETDKDPELSALALYWVAYESNNIGHFGAAADAFQRARERYVVDVERVQHHELRRSQVQARFFEMGAQVVTAPEDRFPRSAEVIKELESLRATLEAHTWADFVTERRHCEETLGDVQFWTARQSPLERTSDDLVEDGDRDALEQARNHYAAGGAHIWARFGHAQAGWALGEPLTDDAYDDLHGSLVALGDAHREPRTRALRHLATYILEVEQKEPADVLRGTWRALWADVNHVGEGITLFSPWQKRNVTKAEFEAEVHSYHKRGRLARRQTGQGDSR
jgi:HAMP domain-containing protein